MMPLSGDPRRPSSPSPPLSSLSPLAAPFTVDRSLFPGSHPHAPTAPLLFPPPPPPHSVPVAADPPFLPPVSRFFPRNSVADAAPYYPCYAQAADPFPDTALKPFSGTEGVDPRAMPPWIGSFEDKEETDSAVGSSWTDPPSSYGVPPLPKAATAPSFFVASDDAPIVHAGDHISSLTDPFHFRSGSSHWPDEMHPEILKGRSEAFSRGFASAILEPSTFVNEVSGSLLLNPCSVSEACNDFYRSSSYDKYITQLESCSIDPYKPMPAHLASTQVSDLVEDMATLVDSGVIGSGISSAQYVNPCRINTDCFGYMITEPMQARAQTDDIDYRDWSTASSNMKLEKTASLKSFPRTGDYVVGSSSVINPVVHSTEINYALGNIELKHSNFPTSEFESIEAHDLKKSYSDSVDQHNLVVDSPCWKGIPSVYQHSFGLTGYRGSCHIGKEPAEYKDFQQAPKQTTHLECSAVNDFQHNSSVSHSGDLSSAFSMPDACQKCEDQKVELFRVEPGRKKPSNTVYIPEELTCEGKEHLHTEASNATKVSQQENVSPIGERARAEASVYPERALEEAAEPSSSDLDSCAKDDTITVSSSEAIPSIKVKEVGSSYLSCNSSGSSDGGNMSQLLLKSMHNLSQVLFANCSSDYLLKAPELEILLSVTENLKALIMKHKQVEPNTVNGIKANNTKSPQVMKTHTNYTQHAAEDGPDCYSSEGVDTDFMKCISQAVDKLPEDRLFDQATGTQALLFKKLWIEAEAALCTANYELQLARMKLEMEDQKRVSKATYIGGMDEAKNSKLSRLSSNLSILSSMKGLGSNSDTLCEVKESCGTGTLRADGGDYTDRQLHEWSTKWAGGLDASVVARLKVLKERNDDVNSLGEISTKQYYDPVSNKADEIDDHVLVGWRGFEGQGHNIESIDVRGYMETKESAEHLLVDGAKKQHRESNSNKADEVDYKVMARWRVLKGRSDNINSDCADEQPPKLLHSVDVKGHHIGEEESVENRLADGEKKQDHASNIIKADEIDDTVVARWRVLKRRSDYISSDCTDEQPKLLHSVDAKGHIGARESVENLLTDGAKKQDQVSNSSKADEVDETVVAKWRVLKGRSDYINSDCAEEQPKFLHSVDVGGHSGKKESIEDLLAEAAKKQDLESNSKKADVRGHLARNESPGIRLLESTNSTGPNYQSPETSLLGIMPQNQQMFEVHSGSTLQHLHPSYSGDGFSANCTWFKLISASPERTADPPHGKSHLFDCEGTQISGTDSGSLSSEWEHVLKEDLFPSNHAGIET